MEVLKEVDVEWFDLCVDLEGFDVVVDCGNLLNVCVSEFDFVVSGLELWFDWLFEGVELKFELLCVDLLNLVEF